MWKGFTRWKNNVHVEDCICMKCKDEETKHKDYNKARDREIEEVRKGNYNFKGIGFKDKKK